VGDAADHDPAGPADSLATVTVERDRVLALLDELLVEEIEHLEKRHVGADVGDVVGNEAALVLAIPLAPDMECEPHHL
jgi:hypothetical protein